MKTWMLDFCPGSRSCIFEMDADWKSPKRAIQCCDHHQALLDSGVTLDELLTVIRQSCALKEIARAEAKKELNLDKKHPGVPYRVNPDGSFTILTGAKGIALTRMRGRIDAALAVVSRVTGTSGVTVE